MIGKVAGLGSDIAGKFIRNFSSKATSGGSRKIILN